MEDNADEPSLRPPPPKAYWPLWLAWLVCAATAALFVAVNRPGWMPIGAGALPLSDAPNSGDTAPPALRHRAAPAEPASTGAASDEVQAVYRCTRGASVIYSSGASCDGGVATLVSVDPSAKLMPSHTKASGSSDQCAALEAQVVQLDDQAKRPLSSWVREGVRAERQRILDRQSALGC